MKKREKGGFLLKGEGVQTSTPKGILGRGTTGEKKGGEGE